MTTFFRVTSRHSQGLAIMNNPDEYPEQQRKKPELIQTKITSAFFVPNSSRPNNTNLPSAKSPQCDSSNSQERLIEAVAGETPKINLYSERRSNLSRPTPSLHRATRSTLLAHTAAETKKLLPQYPQNNTPRSTAWPLLRLKQSPSPERPKTFPPPSNRHPRAQLRHH